MQALRQVPYRVLVTLSSIAGRSPSLRRRALGVLAGVAVVLGVWGWLIYDDRHMEVDLDLWAVAHGTIGLFTAAGDVERVPLPLAVARVLGPLATAGVGVELLLVGFGNALRDRVAGRSAGHLVVVGPADRVRPYLGAAAAPGKVLAVHVDRVLGPPETHTHRTLTLTDDTADGWIIRANAAAARKVVLATGYDDRNLAALAAALDHGVPSDGAEFVVEIDDLSLSLRLSAALAIERPEAHIEVVCVDEVRALFAADAIVAALQQRSANGPAASFAVIGDSALSNLLAGHLAAALRTIGSRTAIARPVLTIVDPDTARGLRLEERIADPVKLDVGVTDSIDRLLEGKPGPLIAFVDFSDPVQTARTAVTLVYRRTGSTIWIAREDGLLRWPDNHAPSSAAGSGLRIISLRQMEFEGRLIGPLTRTARLLEADRTRRQQADRPRWTPDLVRDRVRTITTWGWDVVPTVDLSWQGVRDAPVFLSPPADHEVSQLEERLGVGTTELLQCLRAAGLTVAKARPPT